jgi:hypothetical protein
LLFFHSILNEPLRPFNFHSFAAVKIKAFQPSI